jgi:hypothetical protein
MARDVRGKLADALAAIPDEDVRALVQDMLKATTTEWVAITCKSCGHPAKYPVEVGDAKTRAQVLQILADQGLGRPGLEQGVAPATVRRERYDGALDELSDEELFAVAFPDMSDEEFDAGLSRMRAEAAARVADADGRLRS